MRLKWKSLFLGMLFFSTINAFPSGELEKRELLENVDLIARSAIQEGTSNSTKSGIDKIFDLFSSGKVSLGLLEISKIEKSIKNMVNSVVPTDKLHSKEEVKSFIESIFSNTNGTLIDNVIQMLTHSISYDSIQAIH